MIRVRTIVLAADKANDVPLTLAALGKIEQVNVGVAGTVPRPWTTCTA